MLFSSSIFLVFFLPVTLMIYYIILKKRNSRNFFLLLSSLFFYAWGEPSFVIVMIGSIIFNWLFGLLINRYRPFKIISRLIIIAMLLINFSIMFIFKYLVFTLHNINIVFKTSIPIPQILLPIGISFFTFQAVSYVLDVYRKDAEVQKNLFDVALYIALFPQLIAGPIVRYKSVAEQIKHRSESFEDFAYGTKRFMFGLGKKIFLANNMAIIADKVFAMPANELSVTLSWLGIIAYTLQIFFDFSGYSDMAIGLGRMFGFHFLENFNYPYIARSVSDFWRRWHISLSSWFRDYVYFPLGGSRVSTKKRLILNLFTVWLLTGIWHGANWTFIAWGILYFVLLSFEKLTGFDKRLGKFGHVYTLFFVILGWVFFRSDTFSYAISYISVMFGFSCDKIIDSSAIEIIKLYKYYFILAILFSTPLLKRIDVKMQRSYVWNAVYTVSVLLIFVASLAAIMNNSYNPFIYFNF